MLFWRLSVVFLFSVPPRIPGSRSVADLSVIVRQPIRMECDPTGTPEPEITWFKDGEVVGTEQTAVRVLRAGRILQVTAAEVQDAGVYTCNAQNIAGQEQRRYNLRVQGDFNFLFLLWRSL